MTVRDDKEYPKDPRQAGTGRHYEETPEWALNELPDPRLGHLTALFEFGEARFETGTYFSLSMGQSMEALQLLETHNHLFSITPPSGKRLYPTFQLCDGVRGDPLSEVLHELADESSAARYQFFTTPNDVLGGYSPVDVLVGKTDGVPGPSQGVGTDLRNLPAEDRLSRVLSAARTYRAILAA